MIIRKKLNKINIPKLRINIQKDFKDIIIQGNFIR